MSILPKDDDEDVLKLELEVSLPLSYLELSLLPFHQSVYVSVVRSVLGFERKSSLAAILITLALAAPATYLALAMIMSRLRKLAHAKITNKNTLELFGLWIAAKLVVLPGNVIDYNCHHKWKVIALHWPMEQYYKRDCFPLDYPPLFFFMERFWGELIALVSPADMELGSLFKGSGLLFLLIRITVILSDILYFWAVLYLMRTVTRILHDKAKKNDSPTPTYTEAPSPLTVNMSIFVVCLFDPSLLATDNTFVQYNSVTLGFSLLSLNFLLQRRYLLASFLYCVALLTKQIIVYHGFGYFAFLLLHYCLTVSERFEGSRSFSVNWGNSLKLASIVIGSFACVMLPFRSQFGDIVYSMTGGNNAKLGYPMPNLQFFYSLTELIF